MRKPILKLLFLAGILMLLSYFAFKDSVFNVKTVRAFGDLVVDFHVPIGNPIFSSNNMAPGDSENKNVDVTNSGVVTRLVAVKGIKTSGVGGDPKIETILDLVIKDGVTPLYGAGSPTGAKTLANFFTDSGSSSGLTLNTIAPSGHKTYNFLVTFPSSAGNEFQAKGVTFDLTFGTNTADHLIINEVYYLVDSTHGVDSPKDRGIVSSNTSNTTVLIQGNGAGSKNKVTINNKTLCNVNQSNLTIVQNIINVASNTGGNSANGNTSSSTTINTGSSSASINSSTTGATNLANSVCGGKVGQNNEWVELYNPTDHDISLKDYSLTDNSSKTSITHANKIIKAGGFAILAKDANTFTFWSIPSSALKVELGNQIGDGLDNLGDHLILKDKNNVELDRMSWGSDTSGFTPPAINPLVPLGHSTERAVTGFDTNQAGDFIDKNPPTPGS